MIEQEHEGTTFSEADYDIFFSGGQLSLPGFDDADNAGIKAHQHFMLIADALNAAIDFSRIFKTIDKDTYMQWMAYVRPSLDSFAKTMQNWALMATTNKSLSFIEEAMNSERAIKEHMKYPDTDDLSNRLFTDLNNILGGNNDN